MRKTTMRIMCAVMCAVLAGMTGCSSPNSGGKSGGETAAKTESSAAGTETEKAAAEDQTAASGARLDKPITVTVPFKVGSATDVRARIVMDYAAKSLGQTVTIYNAPGAAGMIGITEMMGKNSKNYELSYCSTSVFTSIPLFNQTTYTMDDIIPLASTDTEQFGMFACPEKSGISNYDDVKSYSKRIKYATGAPGSMGHIMCATSMLLLGLDADHIVTDGASVNLSECLGGSNDLAFAGLGVAKDYVKEGKLVPIYTFNEEDYEGYDGFKVPSLKSLGADFSCESLLFFGARKDTPDEAVQMITAGIKEALANEECQQRLIDAGVMEMDVRDGAAINEHMADELEKFKLYGPKIGLQVIG